MNKIIDLLGFKFWGFKGPKNIKSITLVELMISIVIMSIMFLSFFMLENFSLNQVMGADRKSKVHNDLAYCLEHMSKSVQQAKGAIELLSPGPGFKVQVDGADVSYSLSTPNLDVSCSGGSCVSERLSTRITEFTCTLEGANIIEIKLVGLYDPANAYDYKKRLLNPQVEMKTKLICNSASAH